MENKQPEPSQHMPTITIQQIELNRIELYNTLSAPSYKLWMTILSYMMSLTEKGKHGKSTILRTNKLTIDPEFIFNNNVVIKSNYKHNYEANRNARKLTKELVAANVLVQLDKKDDFILNPLFFYKGDKYGDCYKEWCKLSTDSFKQQFNADYYERIAGINAWTKITDPDITKKEEEEREEKIAQLAQEHQERKQQEEQQRLQHKQAKARQEKLQHHIDNPTHNIFINMRLIEEFGKEDASKCMSHDAYVAATTEMNIMPF